MYEEVDNQEVTRGGVQNRCWVNDKSEGFHNLSVARSLWPSSLMSSVHLGLGGSAAEPPRGSPWVTLILAAARRLNGFLYCGGEDRGPISKLSKEVDELVPDTSEVPVFARSERLSGRANS